MGIIWNLNKLRQDSHTRCKDDKHKLRQNGHTRYKDDTSKLLRVVEPTCGSLVTLEINTDNSSTQLSVIDNLTSLARFLHATISIDDKVVTINFATTSDAESIRSILA